ARDEPRVAFFLRDCPAQPEAQAEPAALAQEESRVLELLGRHGASFATDLARSSGIAPSRLRRIVLELMTRGLVTDDRLDPLRPGADSALQALAEAAG